MERLYFESSQGSRHHPAEKMPFCKARFSFGISRHLGRFGLLRSYGFSQDAESETRASCNSGKEQDRESSEWRNKKYYCSDCYDAFSHFPPSTAS